MRSLIAAIVATLTLQAVAAAEITPIERRWLQGAWPVVAWAKSQGLPLDIVVQPQDAPGAAPIAMAFVDGRCKLVLSMRGNPQVETTFERLEPSLHDAALEMMAAHELGHCRRHLDGTWLDMPAGFVPPRAPAELPETVRDAWTRMQAARREEGCADLVGLAWTRRHHSQRYAALHAWLVAERERDRVPGDHHDTLAWIRTAGDEAFAHGTLFEAAAALWSGALDDTP